MKFKFTVVIAVIGLVLIAAVGSAMTIKTVAVDCSKGQSVAAALEKKADQLIIEISGMCNEHIVVDRSRVILRGSNPSSDGFQGPIEGESHEALVEVEGGVVNVEFENLTFRNGGSRGAVVSNSGRTIFSNCWFLDNGFVGLQVRRGYGLIYDSKFEGNGTETPGFGGARVLAGKIFCFGCEFLDNNGDAFTAAQGSIAYLSGSTLSDLWGVTVGDGSVVTGSNTTINAENGALWVTNRGEVAWWNSEISGGIYGRSKALIRLYGVTQSASSNNWFSGDSTLEMQNSVLPGNTGLDTFTNGSAYGGTEFGTLTCSNGGDFYCDPSVTVGSSTCGLCPDGL